MCIDGEESFEAIVEAIRGARSHIHLAGWHMEADFVVSKDPEVTLEEVLAEAGRRVEVRVLVWGGAPVPPPLRPRRGEAKELGERLSRHKGVHFALDSKERLLNCHHEKIMVVDDDLAFVGGLDFSTVGASRLDSCDHPPQEPMGWHDATVEIRGPLVVDVAEHLRMRWQEVTDDRLPQPETSKPAGDIEAQIVRTVPEKIYDSLPRGDFRLLATYVRALREAKRSSISRTSSCGRLRSSRSSPTS